MLLVLNLVLIWGNSLLPGAQSGEISGGIMELLMKWMHLPDSMRTILHLLIRKTAHFTEFACLGGLMAWWSQLKNEKHGVWMPLLSAMAVALVDESIQLLTPNRGPSLIDVWIDTGGGAVGILVLQCGIYFKKWRKNV